MVPGIKLNSPWRQSRDVYHTGKVQAADGAAGGLFQFLPIILVMVIFYFLLIRPQQKRAKQHREMIAAVRRGDKIITSGGLTGTAVKSYREQ